MMERYLTPYNIHPDSPKRKIYNPVSVWDIGDSLNTINVLETNRKHEKNGEFLKALLLKLDSVKNELYLGLFWKL